jgi:hypothetical protein
MRLIERIESLAQALGPDGLDEVRRPVPEVMIKDGHLLGISEAEREQIVEAAADSVMQTVTAALMGRIGAYTKEDVARLEKRTRGILRSAVRAILKGR